MALQLQTLQLKKNTLIIDAHPVEIDDTGVIKKSIEAIEAEKAMRVWRTGKVVAEGYQDISTKLQFCEPNGDGIMSYINKTVLFMANAVNPIDVPIEGVTTPVLINTEYLISIIDESKSTIY